jgi:sugar fermentation stimulation protein A
MMQKNRKIEEDFHRWPPLLSGTLIRRYKRFLADVVLESGETVTAHCPNSGSMQACAQPGRPVYVSHHDDPRRKLKYTWQIIDMPTSLVGVNTQVPNRLVQLAVTGGRVPELAGYRNVRREVKTGRHTRLDLLLEEPGRRSCFVEIKNCTLVTDGDACFPDAVTTRGLKHLKELQKLSSEGSRSVIFYLVQRMDAEVFHPADHIDAAYGRELRRAVERGVEMLVYDVAIDFEKIRIRRPVPVYM